MTIPFSAEYEKMKRYVYEGDDKAVPEPLDDLPRSLRFALERAKRYTEYAESCR